MEKKGKKETKMQRFREILKGVEIQPSYHRLKILQYLNKHKTHPTVEMIYDKLIKEIPTLSKTTIYSTLNLFMEKGLAKEITIDESELRYELKEENHGHFQCIRCGKIYDIKLSCCRYCKRKLIGGHKLTECHAYFKGICTECLKEKKQKTGNRRKKTARKIILRG